MNREIKFRVWNKEKKHWENNSIAMGTDGVLVTNHNEDFELMQFTGLTDKNGKEIFESDIVSDPRRHGKKWVIEYRTDTEYVGFVLKEIGTNDISEFVSWRIIKIIGNVWEHPELL